MESTYPHNLETIGDHLRRRRLDLGLSQASVAKFLNIELSTVNHWEKNINSPSVQLIGRIIEFLGYNPQTPDHPALSLPSPEDKTAATPYNSDHAEPTTFDQHLLTWRIRHGLTQTLAAKKIGVSRLAFAAWENGRSLPDYNTLPVLIRLLGYLPCPGNPPARLRFYRRALGACRRTDFKITKTMLGKYQP